MSEVGPSDPPANPDPGLDPPEAQPTYDDRGWQLVQLPHDALIASAASRTACPDGCSGQSFIPRHVLWYRKTFTIPLAWKGSAVWLDFEGSFRNTTIWYNGRRVTNHECGYTPFRLHLSNLTDVVYGKPSVLSVFVDPDNGDEGGRRHASGWWYEGGGLYRSVHLVRASTLHIEQDGLFAYSDLTWASQGVPKGATVHASATLTNIESEQAASGKGPHGPSACVRFSMISPDGASVLDRSRVVSVPAVGPGETFTAGAILSVQNPKLWSASTPTLYTLRAEVAAAPNDSQCDTARFDSARVIDELNETHGFRSLAYDADEGFFLNGEHFKVRGFCDHNTFAVVGMAVPDRINLFRAQASRAIGGNGRRTSHNPPETALLSIYDRVGIVVMDENRLFANETRYVLNMGAMVKRDRNHPSVVIWSFCNEAGCEGSHEEGGPRFREIAYRFDGSRPTLANMFTFGDLLSKTIDVQGFSHQTRAKLDRCHERLPHKPIYMSECCSCNTMRDEDEGCETRYDNPHNLCIQKSFNARCAESNAATNASDGVAYAVGTMVWTLFDYYGEPPVGGTGRGREVSSTYGQFDLAGFPKAAAFWYRTQWLLSVADGADKPYATKGAHEVHIVESWEPPDAFNESRGKTSRSSIHAYSNAPLVELLVNGRSLGARAVSKMVEGAGSYAEWLDVPWESGAITAIARNSDGRAVARAERHTNGRPVALRLSIDAPSPVTGTGDALLLDGQDAALLRASVVDDAGRVVHLASHNLSFRVLDGPGVVQGTHNGDPHSHISNDSPWHMAYHGLVRAVIRVTSAAGRSTREREWLAMIDAHGPMASMKGSLAAVPQNMYEEKDMDDEKDDEKPILVEVSSPGFKPATVSIPVSKDAATAGVLAVAAAAAGKPVDFFSNGDSSSTKPVVGDTPDQWRKAYTRAVALSG